MTGNIENALKNLVAFAMENTAYYKNTLRPVSSLADFQNLPIIDSKVLVQNTPPQNKNMLSGLLASAYVFSTGGTTGSPKYTFRDFKDFNDNHLYFDAFDLKPTDIAANLFTPGIWGTYVSHNIGLEKAGCVIVPIGGSDIVGSLYQFSLDTMKKLGVNTLLGTPSIIVRTIERLRENQVVLNIRNVYTVGEKMYDSTYKFIKDFFPNANIKSMYGSVDCAGIGVQCINCGSADYHVLDYVYVEILDENNQPVPDGVEGDIVVTVLKHRLVPIIRYRVGDHGIILKEPCVCGKKTLRVIGRSDQKVIIASAIVSLKNIEAALRDIPQLTGVYQVHITKRNNKDFLTVNLETTEKTDDIISAFTSKFMTYEQELKEVIEENKCESLVVNLCLPNEMELNSHSGKVKKITDDRK